VLSQRINTAQAASIKKRLIESHGTTFDVGGAEVGCLPTPEKMLAIESFPSIPEVKMERLHGVAKAALDGLLDADHLLSLGDKAPDAVRVIPGIGPFWSQGIYMRTCSVADVWPVEPLSNAALGALHGLGDEPSAEDIARLTDTYRPWRTWVCVLLRFAAGRGYIPNIAGREGPSAAARSRKPEQRINVQ
jgi:DNA-3-methyladenine glycosylase II